MKSGLNLVISTVFLSVAGADELQQVRTVKVKAGAPSHQVVASGKTYPWQEATLHARVTGVVAERRVNLGDEVIAGQVLATIAAPEIPLRRQAAEARLQQLRFKAKWLQQQSMRSEELLAKHALSRELCDQHRAESDMAQQEALIAEAEAAEAATHEQLMQVRAPFAGSISAWRVESGDHVEADKTGAGLWLFQIAQTHPLRVRANLAPSSALQVQVGQAAVTTFVDLAQGQLLGRVTHVGVVIDEKSGTLPVEIELPNPQKSLVAGMSCRVQIDVPALPGLLVVPNAALLIREGKPMAARLSEGKVRFVPIRLGRILGAETEVIEGLAADQDIILSPNSLLRDGDAVTATPVTTP